MNKYAGIALMLVLGACSNSDAPKETKSSIEPVAEAASAGVILEDPKLQAIYDQYSTLKDALVSADYNIAKTAAKSLQQDLAGLEGCENTSLIARKISESQDLAAQRKEFTYLSSDLIALFNHATIKTGTIYVEHCPMANKGDGGSWLSSQKKIQNPYFGDEMMECGSVKEEFKSAI